MKYCEMPAAARLVLVLWLSRVTSARYCKPGERTQSATQPFHLQRSGVPALKSGIISELTADIALECTLQCLQKKFCAGINYKEKAKTNKPNCQLTISKDPKFEENSSAEETVWDFYTGVGRRKENPCEENPCKNGGKAVPDANPLSYKCECSTGYEGEHCTVDGIDECSEGSHTCDSNANCTNTVGSYTCQCRSGYTGNGSVCTETLTKSVIFSGKIDYVQQLKQWIGGNKTGKLCWRATRDGWAASTFHSNCDDKAPTVTIVKVRDYVFGGYTTANWTGNGGCKQAPGSFMFSLRNKENIPPFKAPLKDENTQCAIYARHDYGPTFGGGYDLYISNNAASNTGSDTNFNAYYKAPPGVSNTKTILAGTFKFTPSEVEVFHLV